MAPRQQSVASDSDDSPTTGLLARRLRAGLWICVASICAFAVADWFLQREGLLALATLKLAQIGAIAIALLAVRRTVSARRVEIVAVAIVATIDVTTAAAGVLTRDLSTTPFLLVALTMATASLLPWGLRSQLVTALVAAASMVAGVHAVAGSLAAVLGYPALGVAVALASSLYVVREHEQRRREHLYVAGMLSGQTRVLEMVATGFALSEILHTLTTLVEAHAPGLLCSVLLLEDDRLRPVAAPSLPESYNRALDGITIGPRVGSCGTAAYWRKPVVVADIATDPLWTDFRQLALDHGLRACWSAPIIATDGRCLGTFAMYYRRSRRPEQHDWELIEIATHAARVAIERRQTEAALARSREQLEEESRLNRALAEVGQALISSLSTPQILDRLCELATELLECDCSDTVLRQREEDVYVPMSAHGYTPDEWETLRHLHIPATVLAELLAGLADGLPVQVHTERVQDTASTALLRRWGITVSLYLPIRRGVDTVGFLMAAFRGRTEAFTPVQQRIAHGIAQLASIALENARLVEQLTHANQIKSEFVSTMSHELRTPLSVILGYTDMLRDELPGAAQRRTLDRIRRSGLELLEMIEATLDLNRLDAGKDPARFEVVQVADLLGELAADFAAVGGRSQTALRWEPSDALTLWSDRRKLKVILKNLVANALKFTPAGEVVVRCRATRAACVFVVQDTGIGIAREQLPIIFEMFRQVDGSDRRSHGGVGLGLYIARRLVTQLGGDIDVESEPGHGTTFTVSLPALAGQAEVSASA